MTDYTRNPFFGNPYIEKIGDNIIKAFNDDGRGAENLARTKLLNAQTEKATRENQGNLDQQAAIRDIDPSMPISAGFIKGFAASGIAAGMPPAHVADMALYLNANLGRPVGEVARSFVGTGKAIGKDQGFSVEDREGIAKRENDAALNRTSTSSGIAAGAHIQGIRETNQFNEAHPTETRVKGIYLQNNPDQVPGAVFPPHNTPAGGAAAYAPGDPRATATPVPGPQIADHFKVTPGANGPEYQPVRPGLPAMPERSTKDHFVETPGPDGKPIYQPVTPGLSAMPPKIADHFVETPGPDGKPVYQHAAPGLPAMPKDKPPHIINEKAAGQVEMEALNNHGLWDAGNNRPDDVYAQQNAKQLQAARIALSDTLQKTGNPGLAAKAFTDTLGLEPGSTVSTRGAIRQFLGSDPVKVTPPPGATPNGTPAGTQQAAPKISEQFAAPAAAAPAQSNAMSPPPADPAQRKVGQAYPTPKGVMIWTAQGWVPQQAANDGAR